MEAVRYYLALVLVVSLLPAIGFWLLTHGFIGFWRRLGPALSYPVLFIAVTIMGLGIFRLRARLLSVEFGTHAWLLVPAGLVYAASVVVEILCRRHLSMKTLVGFPELSPSANQKLLQEGIYARVRHPRYLSALLAVVAFTFLTNYLATYLLVPLCVAGFWLVTFLEERELTKRFGREYIEYRARVPRLLPSFRSAP